MTVQEKKQRFRDLVVPAVNKVYADLEAEYQSTKKIVDKGIINAKIKKLMKSYSAKSPQDLLTRMKPHAKSVAIAQAAMESAWETSRFARDATNLFGVWSFNKNEPRVPAGEKRGKKTIYVKKYPSIEASIRDYYHILATGRAFNEFREQKMKSNDPYQLVKKLDKYSEKGAEYGKELASMIRYNRFYEFD
ncbi:MAG: glucosaminidase domain-containing protein [Sulfurimonas sp.]|nr:glucosaminidase domain-containing protein [Sulfurimonas sp.]